MRVNLPRTDTLFPAAVALLLFAGCSPAAMTGSTGGGGPPGSGGASATSTGDTGTGGATTTSSSTGDASSSTASSGSGGGGGFDPNVGWTDFVAGADTHKIYVSSSTGKDTNDGLSPATALKTLAAGIKLVRDGFPDWLLLLRGDTWTGENFGRWTKSGKSAAEPILISYYGDMKLDRPLLKTGDNPVIQAYSSPSLMGPVSYVALVGLHFTCHTRDPSDPAYALSGGSEAIRWVTHADGLLVEDMEVQFYRNAITFQGAVGAPITNAKVRRSVLTDQYSGDSGHSQGIYAQSIDSLLIEENVFDHNGWNEQEKAGFKTIYNHNMYLHQECTAVVVQNNLSARASSHGLQARTGGMVMNNLFVRNSLGFSFGLVRGSPPLPGGVTGEAANNIILESVDIDLPANPRGTGIELGNIKMATVHDNIIAHNKSADPKAGAAIEMDEAGGVGLNDLTLKDNILYDWHGNITMADVAYSNVALQDNAIQTAGTTFLVNLTTKAFPAQFKFSGNTYFSGSPAASWFQANNVSLSFAQWITQSSEQGAVSKQLVYKAPDRTLADYNQSIGQPATFDAYIASARKQARGHYVYDYTVAPALAYIRDGFTP